MQYIYLYLFFVIYSKKLPNISILFRPKSLNAHYFAEMSSSLISVMFGDHCWHLELYHIKLIFIFAWTIPLSAIGIVHCNRIQVSSMDKQSYPIPSNRRPRSWVINQIRQVRLANQKRVNKLLDQHHPVTNSTRDNLIIKSPTAAQQKPGHD